MVKITLIVLILISSFSAFSGCCNPCLDDELIHSEHTIDDECSKQDQHSHSDIPQPLSSSCNCICKSAPTLEKKYVVTEFNFTELSYFVQNPLREINFHQIIFHPPIS